MQVTLLVGLGGFLGSVARHVVSTTASRLFGEHFPYGTLCVNATGCFLIGLVMELATEFEVVTPGVRLFLTTGFLGGFTTFSTFSFETVSMALKGNSLRAGLNAGLQTTLGITMVLLGRIIAHKLVKG